MAARAVGSPPWCFEVQQLESKWWYAHLATGTSCVMAGDGSRHTSIGGRQGKQQGSEPSMGLPAAYVDVLAVGHLLYSLLLIRDMHCNGDWSRLYN